MRIYKKEKSNKKNIATLQLIKIIPKIKNNETIIAVTICNIDLSTSTTIEIWLVAAVISSLLFDLTCTI